MRECYDGLKELIGQSIEPFAIVQTVDEYRMYWKPEKVRIILLAESHVHTTREEFLSELDCTVLNLPGYPKNFIRFVYCLGYGENSVLCKAISKNPGSLGFWKIFFSTCNHVTTLDDFSPLMKTRSFHDTVPNKIGLVHEMKKRGIWLVDASIIGINGEHRPSPGNYRKILLHCWDYHIKEMIAGSAPEQVIIIGKGVGHVLGNRVSQVIGRQPVIISQPNGHISREERFEDFRQLYRICSEARSFTMKAEPIRAAMNNKGDDAKMAYESGHTIRAIALEWAKMKFGKLSSPAYCSKYYESPESWTGAKAWWIQLPLRSIVKNTHVFFLLQKSPDVNDFYCLTVPTSYLKENDSGLARLGNKINLFLSAEEGRLFQDQRGQGKVGFEQFAV